MGISGLDAQWEDKTYNYDMDVFAKLPKRDQDRIEFAQLKRERKACKRFLDGLKSGQKIEIPF